MPDPQGERFIQLLTVVRERGQRQLLLRYARQFLLQSDEVVAAYRAGLSPIAALDDASREMQEATRRTYVRTTESVGVQARKVYGYRAKPPPYRVVNEAGRRIVSMNGITKRRVEKILRQALTDDLPTRDTVKRLRAVVADPKRARLIARTEIAMSTNQALGEVMLLSGESHAEVLDGPECGWLSHGDLDKANGKVVTTRQMLAHPIAHPNCVRAFAPLPRETLQQRQREGP